MPATAGTAPRTGIRARWRARPGIHSRAVWALIIAFDVLPWPWGEDLFSGLFAIAGMLRPSRRRRALAWARQQPGRSRWRLAVALCAFLGRWTARYRLLGVRSPGDLRRRLVVEGLRHLHTVPGPAILLGFHIGPPHARLGLELLGHRVTSVVFVPRDRPGWWRPAWWPLFASSPDLSPDGNRDRWLATLYRASGILRDGGTIHLMADGFGRELCRIPLPGGPAVIRGGWLNLQRHTGARVFPMLTHLQGRTQVVTIHPELALETVSPGTPVPWEDTLASLLRAYVARFPEQCFGLVFAPRLLPALPRRRPDK